MPGKAEYFYVLRMQGDAALKEAQAFAKAVKREMQQIKTTADVVLKARVDTSGSKKAALTEAQQLEKEYKAGLKKAQSSFSATATKYGAGNFTASFRSMWEEGTIKPGMEAITQIRKAEGALVNLGKTAKRMGVTTDDLVDMGRLDRGIASVQAIQRKMWGLRGLGYQLESYGKGMAASAAAIGGSLALAGNEYLKFADPMNKAARNLDLNAELTEVLDHKLVDLAGTMSMMSPKEQADGLYLWAAATGAVIETERELDKTLAQADQVQRLAKLGNVSYGVAVEATTDILSQYQLNVSETERVVSTLIKVAAVSKAEVADLAQAFTFAGARAAQANTSFEDTASTLQLLSAFGLRGSRAGRGLGMLMENLIAPSQVAKKEMDALFTDVFGRTDVFTNAEGQFIGLADAVGVLAQATQHLTEMEKQEFVARLTSQNASRALVPLLALETKTREQGISAIEATSNILTGSVGEQERAFIRMMELNSGYEMSTESATDTADRYWTQLAESMSGRAEFIKARFSAAMVDTGREVTKALVPVMEKIAALAADVATYVSEHPEAAKVALGLTAGLGILGLLTTAVGKGIRLVADVKTIAMATSLYNTAKNQVAAATEMMIASQRQLQAAGLMEVAAEQGAMGAALEGGGDIAEGVDQLSTLGGLGLGLGAVVGLAMIMKKIYDVNQAHLEEAAQVTQTTDTYRDYVAAMEEAGRGKYTLTEATYELVKAKQAEQEEFDAAALAEYEKALRDAAAATLTEATQALDVFGGDLFAMDEADFKDTVSALTNYLGAELDELQIKWVKQGDLADQLADHYHLNAEQAEYLADALRKMAYATTLPTEPMGRLAAEQELSRREAARAAAEYGGVAEGIEKTATAAEKAELSWKDQVEALNEVDLALQKTRLELQRMIAALEGVPGTAGALDALRDKLGVINSDLRSVRFAAIGEAIKEGSQAGLASLEDLADGAESAADSAFEALSGLSEIWTDEQILAGYDEYLAELDQKYREAAMMDARAGQLHIQRWQEAWEADIEAHLDAQEQITKDAEDAEQERTKQMEQYQQERQRLAEQAQSGMRRLVEQALQPTSVTGLDMLETDIGAYADKWDEAARRMRAAMEDPGGEWGWMIPEDVKAQGIDSAKAWGARWIDEFYAGMHPDQIDWPGFIASFQQSLQRETAKGQLVETAIAKLAEQGITATSEQVLSALGLESPLQKMFLGGLSPEDASKGLSGTMGTVVSGISVEDGAFDTAAGTVSSSFSTALGTKLGETTLPSLLNALWTQQMTDTPDPIIAVGKAAGSLFWKGFESSLEGSTLVDFIYDKVMTEIAAIIESL